MKISEVMQLYYDDKITEQRAILHMDEEEAKEAIMDLWNKGQINHSYFGINKQKVRGWK